MDTSSYFTCEIIRPICQSIGLKFAKSRGQREKLRPIAMKIFIEKAYERYITVGGEMTEYDMPC